MLTRRTCQASLIRHRVLNYVLEACRTRDFAQVHVAEICQAAGISKVTFFKYFNRKEDILLLFFSLFNTRLCLEIRQQKLTALAALEFIIQRFGKMVQQTPSLARELVATLLHTRPPVMPFRLTEADRALFFPDTDFSGVEILSFRDLVEGLMLEGVLNNQITRMASPPELTALFMANLYGAIVTAHLSGAARPGVVFGNIARTWLRCLS